MKTQLYVSNDSIGYNTEKLFKHDGFFGNQNSDLTLEKLISREFISIHESGNNIAFKNNEEAIYVVNVALTVIAISKFSG